MCEWHLSWVIYIYIYIYKSELKQEVLNIGLVIVEVPMAYHLISTYFIILLTVS